MLLRKHIPFGYVVLNVRRDAILLLSGAIAIYLLQQFTKWGLFAVPLPLLTVLGTGISLLLAFRINQSYDRWWEARIIWGGIVNDSRTLIRQVLTFVRPDSSRSVHVTIKRIALRQAAWCYVLARTLRQQTPTTALTKLLEPAESDALQHFDNKANALLTGHSHDIQLLFSTDAIDSFQMMQIDDTIVRLCDHMGKCERIKSTVFPVTYSLFLRCFIYLFIFIIPFGLGAGFGISEIPITVSIGVAFFLIEKTATLMQDPFEGRPTDTAMLTISTNIHRTILQMIGEKEELPEPYPAASFYAM